MPGERLRPGAPGAAWFLLTAALAVHVLDEAWGGFLAFYNPAATRIREIVPLLPIPSITFSTWITALIAGVAVLIALTPVAARKARWLRPVALLYAGLMVLNALGHVAWSVAVGRLVPGTYSAPLLLAAAVNLLVSAHYEWGAEP